MFSAASAIIRLKSLCAEYDKKWQIHFVTFMVRYTYKDSEGRKQGCSVEYFQDCGLSTVTFYKDDVRHGNAYQYYSNGNLFTEKEYHEGGKVNIFKERYRNGYLQDILSRKIME